MREMTKNLFLNALTCETLGWRMRRDTSSAAFGLGEQFLVDQGREVGERARLLYPEGVLVDARGRREAVAVTAALLAGDADTLFEAAFEWEGYVARADILRRGAAGWRLIEVKSSVNDKPELVDDLAYTLMVIEGAGVQIESAELLLVSRDYRLGMEVGQLFASYDHTDDARERAAELYRPRIRQMGSFHSQRRPQAM